MHQLSIVLLLGLIVVSSAQLLPYLFSPSEVTQWGARCLDGSPSGFYFQNSSNSAYKDKWSIYIQGGGYCLSGISGYLNVLPCSSRATTDLGSSKYWPSSEGNYSPLDFANYNQVFIPYCGGDLHSGTRNETDSNGLYYAGHLTVVAIITKLMKDYGMSSAVEVFLFGTSAGGIAVFVNADTVREMIPPTATLRLLSDAGWFIAVDTFNPQYYSVEQAMIAIYNNSGGYVNQACAKALGNKAYLCYSGNYSYQYLTSPIFISESNFDTNQLYDQNGVPQNSSDVAANNYIVTYFGPAMQDTLKQILANKTTGLYLTSTLTHSVSISDYIAGGPYAGQTLGGTVLNWTTLTGAYQVYDGCKTPRCANIPYTTGSNPPTSAASSTSSTSSASSTTSSPSSSPSSTSSSSSHTSAATSFFVSTIEIVFIVLFTSVLLN